MGEVSGTPVLPGLAGIRLGDEREHPSLGGADRFVGPIHRSDRSLGIEHVFEPTGLRAPRP